MDQLVMCVFPLLAEYLQWANMTGMSPQGTGWSRGVYRVDGYYGGPQPCTDQPKVWGHISSCPLCELESLASRPGAFPSDIEQVYGCAADFLWYEQLINFRYMPLAYRVPFQSTCGVFWTLYLSILNAK